MTTISVSVDGANINVREVLGDAVHRRVVHPGSVVAGEWVATDMTNEPPAVQQAAADAWTEEVVAEYRARIEADAVVLPPTVEDYRAAIQSHVDATAQSRRYDGGTSLASYASSSNAAWAAEAQAFIQWRDDVWIYTYAELDSVTAGEREQPTVEAFLGELPTIAWPETID